MYKQKAAMFKNMFLFLFIERVEIFFNKILQKFPFRKMHIVIMQLLPFLIKGAKKGELKKKLNFIFHPMLMQFSAK